MQGTWYGFEAQKNGPWLGLRYTGTRKNANHLEESPLGLTDRHIQVYHVGAPHGMKLQKCIGSKGISIGIIASTGSMESDAHLHVGRCPFGRAPATAFLVGRKRANEGPGSHMNGRVLFV